jgi:hypothetical protein
MAKVDKRWAWLSLPVILILAFMCCCGGGGIIYLLIPSGPKVIYSSNSPDGEVRLDVSEQKHGGSYTYELNLIQRSSNKTFAGGGAHLTADKQAKWGAEWIAGTCVVSCTEGGFWFGTWHNDGTQTWIAVNSK